MLAEALAPAPEPSRPDRRFLDALRTKIEPVPLPFTYKAALAVVALAMVLLPLLYVTLIGLAAWGVAWYAMNGWALLDGIGSSRLQAASYITPLIVGGTVVLFMIKPLFARRQKTDDEVPIDPAKEPLLFEFVRRTAVAVGAPVPREIRLDHEVNASASLRRGLLSLFSDDLVLTIGVPLAAGMTVEQLAGVLAHEFGHFGQRAGMRLSHIVRSVSYWFARVVYERDRFDARLEHAVKESGDFRIRLVAWIAAAFVWIGRTILKGLMYVGHVISSSLLRQMEFDADRY
ncbi:MAG TPA: M48 family metallopeptidase, partial [Thermoanaerobaculia bacterium]|nr:M48 family metallopeptidase [Thermoanaerobaculia bacterium]